MKQLFLLVLLFIKTAEFVESTPAADPSTIVKYHGGVRYWTIVDSNGKTYVSFNVFKKAVNGPVKLLFPKDKTMDQLLSDLTLFSPTNAEDPCKTDISKLDFKLVFNNENWIRGEVINQGILVNVYMYMKCPADDGTRNYAINAIDENEANFEDRRRLCFQSENPFLFYNDSKNVMELQVSATFKCKVFLILPNYMEVEDEVLKNDVREPLNATFAAQGEDFWWKGDNNESLPDGISFVGRDVVVNITNSTKAIPYFLRIGNNQPYPSLIFKFDPTCANQQFDLFVNLRNNDACRIKVKLDEDGLSITTKGGVSHVIQNGTKSATLIFARGQSNAYLKAGLSIISMEVCQIENAPDVPSDQFVLQFAPSETSTVCNQAQVIFRAGDVKNKIEVLVDRVKAAALIPKFNETDNSTYSSSAAVITSPNPTAGDTTDVATGALQWWWIVVPVLVVGVIVAAVILICYCIRHQRKQTSSKSKSRQSNVNVDQKGEKLNPTSKIETAIPVEQPAPPSKEKSKMDMKMKKKEAAEKEVGESNKSTKRIEKEKKNHYEQLPTIPPTQGPPPTISATQEDPTLEAASTQVPSNAANSIVQTDPTQNQSLPGNTAAQTRTTQNVSSQYIKFGS